MANAEARLPNSQLLEEIFCQYADVQAVYLFGSHATGHTHPGSDLDLAIVPRHPIEPAQKLAMFADLARHGFCEVDLVFLDTDDIVLKYEAVRLNRVVYQTEDFERGTLYSRVVRQYLDFLHYLNVQRAAYKRRLLLGQNRGHSQTTELARCQTPSPRRNL